VSVVANVAVNLDSSQAVRALDALNGKADQVTRGIGGAFQNVGDKLQSFGARFQNIGGVLAGLGAGAALGGIVKAGMESDNLNRRINALAGSSSEAQKIFAVAGEAASKFGLSQNAAADGVADLYGRLAPTGVALNDIKSIFFGVNNAANKMGLSGEAVSGVMLQLSQALGSGKLQGDELRSIMEQLPAVGQAVAKVMGVTVGEIKQLGADGKITTDIMIKATKELEKMAGVDPTPMKVFQAALADLQTELGQQLVPVILPVIKALTELLKVFGQMPGPLKTITAAVIGLAGGFVVLAPLIAPIGAGISLLASAITAVTGFIAGSGGLAAAISAIVAIITGPVGWIAAIVALGVIIYKFRDQIGGVFVAIGKSFNNVVVKPFNDAWKQLTSFMPRAMKSAADAVTNIWRGMINAVKTAINTVLKTIANSINAVGSAINTLIRSFNRLPGAPQIPQIPSLKVPQFADGGYVNRATLAMVGEGGEPEYIIPESKMAAASANYLQGQRGAGIIGSSSGSGVPQINITTGPVMEFDGRRYVTLSEYERGLRQTAEAMLGRLRTPAARAALGMR
jgi:tape measure domain-containing protein